MVFAGNYGAPGGFWYDPWSQDDPIMVIQLSGLSVSSMQCNLSDAQITTCFLAMLYQFSCSSARLDSSVPLDFSDTALTHHKYMPRHAAAMHQPHM